MLTGGLGGDIITGGAGNDIYAVDSSGDAMNVLANILTGNGANNTLFRDSDQDILVGGAGADVLTGGQGKDTFRYTALKQSLMGAFDQITGLAIGTESIDSPTGVSATNLKEILGTVSTLNASAIQDVLPTTTFRKSGAATFIVNDSQLGTTRTFLALNDGTASFSANIDALIEFTGYSCSLAILAVIRVGNGGMRGLDSFLESADEAMQLE